MQFKTELQLLQHKRSRYDKKEDTFYSQDEDKNEIKHPFTKCEEYEYESGSEFENELKLIFGKEETAEEKEIPINTIPNEEMSLYNNQIIDKRLMKCYSQIIPNTCYSCLTETSDLQNRYQCPKCFKCFHKNCYHFSTTLDSQCFFCELFLNNQCCQCHLPINDFEIDVKCEFCGNKMHLNCLSLSINILLKRSYYSRYYEDPEKPHGQEFFESLQQALRIKEEEIRGNKNQKAFYSNIILNTQRKTGYDESNSISILNTLFSVCMYCKNKPYTALVSIVIYKSTYYQLLNYSSHPQLDLHELFFPSISSLNHFTAMVKDKEKKEIMTQIKKPEIKRIVGRYFLNDGSYRCYYLIKWTNGIYSIELGDFISFYQNFQKLFYEYSNRAIHQYQASMDNYFTYRLSLLEKKKKKESGQYVYDNISSNVLHLYETDKGEEMIKISSLLQLLQDIYNSIRIKPKILLCTDDANLKLKLKTKQKSNSLNATVTSINATSGLEKIVYELITYEKESNRAISVYQEILSKLRKENKEEVLKYLNEIQVDFYLLDIDILVISPSTLSLSPIQNILLNFKFNMFIFDISKSDINSSLDIISSIQQYYTINSGSLIYLMAKTTNIPWSMSSFIQKLFLNDNSKLLLNKDSILTNEKQILNKSIINFPCDGSLNELLNYFRTHFNWGINFNQIWSKKGTVNISQLVSQMMVSYNKQSILNIKSKVKRVIVNFIAVYFDQNESRQYYDYIKSKLNNFMNKDINKKKNIAASLSNLCSFPFIMNSNGYSYQSLKNKYKISSGKFDALKNICKDIGAIGHKILIIYSIDNHAIDHYYQYIELEIKEMKFKANIEIYQITDKKLEEEIGIDQFLYVILFNSFAFDQNRRGILNRIFSREKIIVFQLYILNSFEQRLLKAYYCNIDQYTSEGSMPLEDIFKAVDDEGVNYESTPFGINTINKENIRFKFHKGTKYYLNDEAFQKEENVSIINNSVVLYCVNSDELLNENPIPDKINDENELSLNTENQEVEVNQSITEFQKEKIKVNRDNDNESESSIIENNPQVVVEISNCSDSSFGNDDNRNIVDFETKDIKMDYALNNPATRNTNIDAYGFLINDPIDLNAYDAYGLPIDLKETEENQKHKCKPKQSHKKRTNEQTIQGSLISIASRLRFSNDKTIQLSNLLLFQGFTYHVRETLLSIISDRGVGFGITSNIKNQEEINEMNSLISYIQLTLSLKHEIIISNELIRLYLEYFVYSLLHSLPQNEENEFLFFLNNPMVIKSQLLLIYLNFYSQEELLQMVIRDTMMNQFNLSLCENNKAIITEIVKRILDDCKENGYNNYKQYIQTHVSNCSKTGFVPIKKEFLMSTQDTCNQAELFEMIDSLYTDLFNTILD